MKSVKIADLKNNLSRHLVRVRQGGEITVVDRDTPIARIVPFVHGSQAAPAVGGRAGGARKQREAGADRLAGLVKRGVVAAGDLHAVSSWVATHEPIRRPKGSPSAVKALLQMRRESTR